MLNKINFLLSIIVFGVIIFFACSFFNGFLLAKVLYSEMKEIHVVYHPQYDYEALIDELPKVAAENQSDIFQYQFLSTDDLMIVSAKKPTHLRLKAGHYPTANEAGFVANYPSKQKLGILDFPCGALKIRLFFFAQLRSEGIGSVFYANGNIQKFIDVLKKYGTVKVKEPVQSSLVTLDSGQLLIGCYIILFLLLSIGITAFQQKKIIAVKKMLGYSMGRQLLDASKELLPLALGAFNALVLMSVLQFSKLQAVFGWIVLIVIICLVLIACGYLGLVMLLQSKVKIALTVNGHFYRKITLFSLAILLCGTLLVFLNQSLKLQQELQTIKKINNNHLIWKQTKHLYKTNITNQLDRNDATEEQDYLKKAQVFYELISKKWKTFIIAPYNYVELQRTKKNDPIFVGEMRGFSAEEYITEPGGIDLTIDENYLKRNPVSFVDARSRNRINQEKNTLYLLVPEKYRSFEQAIKANYLDSTKFYLKEDPPNYPVALDKITIETLYVENNQNYFTYNPFYSTPEQQHTVKDPIAIVVNPHLMSGLFWGNLLTEHGGLFFDVQGTKSTAAFDQIKPQIKQANLQNTVNSTKSVYKEVSNYIRLNQTQFLAYVSQFSLLIGLICILNVQLVGILYQINTKKIFIKQAFGYSFIEQAFDVVFWPLIIESGTLLATQFLYGSNLLNVIMVSLLGCSNLLWFIIYRHKKQCDLKKGGML
ncbi:hypothetical protein ACSFB8_04640 [Enterococcus faecalis]